MNTGIGRCFFRDEHGGRRRYEPWMTPLVDTDTGRVLGVVDGRDSAGVGSWLAAGSQAWRNAVEVVAIDPSAAFRKALREHLPAAALSVDAFHLVKLANDMVTTVRQRVAREARAAADAWRTRPGSTGGCCCAPATPSARPGWPGSRPPCAPMIRPTRSAPPGASRNGSARC
jgi:hypothetical protein